MWILFYQERHQRLLHIYFVLFLINVDLFEEFYCQAKSVTAVVVVLLLMSYYLCQTGYLKSLSRDVKESC